MLYLRFGYLYKAILINLIIISSLSLTNVYSGDLPTLSHSAHQENFFDVSGRRLFLVGNEDGNVEIWSPPFQMLSEFKPLTKDGKNLIPLSYTTNVASGKIDFNISSHNCSISYFALSESPAMIVKITTDSAKDIDIYFKCTSMIRPNWPLDPEELDPVNIYTDNINKSRTLVFERKNKERVLVGGLQIQNADITSTNGAVVKVNVDNSKPAYLIIAGIDYENADTLYKNLLAKPEFHIKEIERNCKDLIKSFPSISISGSSKTNKMLEETLLWAMVSADKTYMKTPGVGEGYVAGFNTSKKFAGSGLLATNNGRPGFAWYFGRDFLWMSMVLSMLNQWDKVKNNFKLLSKYQNDNGKIMHELTSSVSLMGKEKWAETPYYFAAADSNPLYIIALRRYLDASGDAAFIKKMWPSILKAFSWMISADYDGDGLIDNYAGHGWVEGGPLAENQHSVGHTTFYLASLYVKSLKDMSYMSKIVSDLDSYNIAISLIGSAEGAMKLYWNDKGYYNHRRYPDGSYGTEITVAPSVALLFKLIDEKRAVENLYYMNDKSLVTSWGARFISDIEPNYDPDLYHSGNVWPLFTGWLSLANYKYGFSEGGYYLMMSNLKNTYDNCLGCINEVFGGDRYIEVGSPHQGWSETMGLWPFMEGLVGIKPDALKNRLILEPNFPDSVDKIKISNLRIKNSIINLTVSKNGDNYNVYKEISGPPVNIRLVE